MKRKGIIYSCVDNAKVLYLDILIETSKGYQYNGFTKYYHFYQSKQAVNFCQKYLDSFDVLEKEQYKKPYTKDNIYIY